MIKAKFRASRRLRFEDTKRIMSHEIRPKSFGTFEKQAPGPVHGANLIWTRVRVLSIWIKKVPILRGISNGNPMVMDQF